MNGESIQTLAPAKLNLFLHVIGRRSDGYHELQSLFALLDFGDLITLTIRSDGEIRRKVALLGVDEEADLTVRAARGLQRASGSRLGVDIVVDKRIPMGGGMGGGSSDAGTVLLALNRLWNLGWPAERLAALGLELGADIPFFVRGQDAWVEGVGERIRGVGLPRWWYLVLNPVAHVPTPFVFNHPELTRNTPALKMEDFSANGWGAGLLQARNDLQPVVLKEFPEVKRALQALDAIAKKSIFGARMTGSGASVFAAFEDESSAREALSKRPPEIPGFVAQGLARHPLWV